MRKDPEKILQILKKVTLSAEEKSAMRFVLISHIETQERIRNINKKLYARQKSPFSFQNFIFGKRMLAGMVVILLVASTGVSLAAEDTLPGDLLYGVKIKVTEEVRGALTVGSTAKGKWEKDRVVKRVVETEKLIKDKKLTPARKVEAETAIKKQIQKFDAIATSEKENTVGVFEATSDLEPTLKAHQEILETLAVESPSIETNDIIKTVEEGIRVSGAQESAAIDSISATNTVNELSITVDEKITDAENAMGILSKIENELSETLPPQDTVKEPTTEIDTEGLQATDTPKDSTLEPKVNPETPTNTQIAPIETITNIVDPLVQTINTEPVTTTEVQPKTTENTSIASESNTPVIAGGEEVIILTNPDDAKIKSEKIKESLLKAKEMIALAKEKKKNGDLEEALRIAQQVYKDIFELNVGAQLSKDAAEDQKKIDIEANEKDTTVLGAEKIIGTDTTAPVEADAIEEIDNGSAALQAQAILPIQ